MQSRATQCVSPGQPSPTVRLFGEHDLATVATLYAELAGAIAAGVGDLVVDLSQVSFMDASTIGVLMRTRRALLPAARTLRCTRLSPAARRVIVICGLQDALGARPPNLSLVQRRGP